MNSIARESRVNTRSSDAEQENTVWSEDGRFESFDLNGHHYVIDWDEIDPPGGDTEPEVPHEIVMQEMKELVAELMAARK